MSSSRARLLTASAIRKSISPSFAMSWRSRKGGQKTARLTMPVVNEQPTNSIGVLETKSGVLESIVRPLEAVGWYCGKFV